VHQTEREGCFNGRKFLTVYMLCTIGLIVALFQLLLESRQTLESIDFTLSSNTETSYDKFETKVAPRFNDYYFDALCTDVPDNSWFLNTWVAKHCPSEMSLLTCEYKTNTYLQEMNKEQVCDESLDSCSLGGKFNPSTCCPSEMRCKTAFDAWKNNEVFNSDDLEACPYHQCRRPALKYVYTEGEPLLKFGQAVCYLLIGIVFLTLLLICYRPRDDLTAELIKTGVVVERRDKKPVKERRQTRTSDAPQMKSSSRGHSPHRDGHGHGRKEHEHRGGHRSNR
jgi:hypothetical protein